ncbi:rho GTPase-activating protein 23, partial [Orussus abietinus]|uniref:rho GTPase-activating protein 23 n=1 Tax=Orussus abietinus TaxID=222816 RepID=UPI000C716357
FQIGHSSPPPPAPTSGNQQREPPSRGPRTLLLRRSENGFGFTLRHFIVYPPESCCMLPGHERTKIDEPMDTIFVKQVRANSPAAEAGLRTGDRVVSVDGAPTRGEQYASVVQRIQQAGPWLRLLVVSKEDDILQRYFGETAHNPETNPRPRLRSPERISQKQRRSSSMIPGPSPRTRQSWVCSPPPGSENQGTFRTREDIYKEAGKMLANVQRRPLEARNQEAGIYEQRSRQRDLPNPTPQPYRPPSDGQRFDLYDRTRPESIYSRPSSEQIYDRIKDPIYERVRPDGNLGESLDRYPVSRAEPQVPIYQPGRRIVGRRASEGSGMAAEVEAPSFGSVDILRTSNPGSRTSMDSRRDSSPASKDSLSSYDSNSTLTGNECSDDSVIMNRLRKSFEQKEEFLRRPSHPIGWLLPEDSLLGSQSQGVIQREFYARPQKLQRQVWPPSEQAQQAQAQDRLRQTSPQRTDRTKSSKPSNQSVQRVMDSEGPSPKTQTQNDSFAEDSLTSRERFYSSLYEDDRPKEDPKLDGQDKTEKMKQAVARNLANNKAAFVTTLSRIHENVAAALQQSQDPRNGTSSLPSSPGPDKKSADKFPVPPQGLQIVSRRAKQFESGKLLSDDDEPTSDRTNLYKSELSRLSSKRSVPNVAVRKREFESKAESQEPRRIQANRESKSLDSGRGLSGNRIIPVGSKYIHCEPPAGYREVKETPAMETEPVRLRARSNSAESWEAVNGSSRRAARHTWQTEPEDADAKRNKAKRQDSYLQAVKTQLEREPQNLRGQDAFSERDEAKSDEPNAPLFPSTISDALPAPETPKTSPRVTVSPPQPVRPNRLSIPNPLRPSGSDATAGQNHHLAPAQPNLDVPEDPAKALAPASSDLSTNGVVLRRQKNSQISDEDRATRRVSYLKATWGERMHVDSDLELSDSEPVHAVRSAHRRWRPPLFPSDITPLRRIFEDMAQAASLHRHSHHR